MNFTRYSVEVEYGFLPLPVSPPPSSFFLLLSFSLGESRCSRVWTPVSSDLDHRPLECGRLPHLQTPERQVGDQHERQGRQFHLRLLGYVVSKVAPVCLLGPEVVQVPEVEVRVELRYQTR